MGQPEDALVTTRETVHMHPDPDTGPWRLSFRWREIAGRPECVGFRLAHVDPAPGMEPVGEALLRSLNISARIARDRASLLRRRGVPTEPPAGMRKATFARLQRVAAVYREARAAGRPPTKAVAEELGVAQGTASATVSKARAIGLLPPTSAGVSLGEVEPS